MRNNDGAVWLTDKYICVMLLVFPLWTGLGGYGSITVSKYRFFAVLTAAWALSVVFCLAREKTPLARVSGAQAAAAAFMAAVCVSALLSPWKDGILIGASRYDGVITLLLYGVIFLGVSMFGRPRKRYIFLLGVSCALCCVLAVFQLYRVNLLGLFPEGYDYYGADRYYSGAFLGTIGNTDVLAAYLCLCIPALFALPALTRKGTPLLLVVPAALGAYIIARSGVASGAVALAGCALVCAPAVIGWSAGKRRLAVCCWCVSGAVALCALAAVYFSPADSGTLWELKSVLHGEIDDSFGSHRIEIWRECLRLIGERPVTGGGPGTLGLRTSLGWSRYVEETGATLSVFIDNAHNEYLNYLVNTGVCGLLSYLAVVFFSLRGWLMSTGSTRRALGCSAVCYLMQSFFGLGLCLVVPLVFIFLGLLCSAREEND